jgi:hypothetical protein
MLKCIKRLLSMCKLQLFTIHHGYKFFSLEHRLLLHFYTLRVHSLSTLRHTLNSPDSIRDTSYAEYEDGYTSDSSGEFPVVSLSQLDAKRYLYSNGINVCEGGEAVQQLVEQK